MNLEQLYKKETGLIAYTDNDLQTQKYSDTYVEWLEAKINITGCCETLKSKQALTFEDWLSNFKKEDNKYWLNKYTQYCKEAMKLHYNILLNK